MHIGLKWNVQNSLQTTVFIIYFFNYHLCNVRNLYNELLQSIQTATADDSLRVEVFASEGRRLVQCTKLTHFQMPSDNNHLNELTHPFIQTQHADVEFRFTIIYIIFKIPASNRVGSALIRI